jgi:prepilin-type N-terminal cleavage/methylation domain-containing protein
MTMVHAIGSRRRSRAFTLVELLVVIAIIALLVSLLLPALARARIIAQLAVSLSNNRQILVSNEAYRTDFKGTFPLRTSPDPRAYAGAATAGPAWCSWSYGGKNANIYWRTRSGGLFDDPAGLRPMNSYVYPNQDFSGHDSRDDIASQANRDRLELSAFRSPGDKVSYQRTWDSNPLIFTAISSYDDVGTSYHANWKWWNWLLRNTPARAGESTRQRWDRVAREGGRRMTMATNFTASQFVWLYDQTADVVVYEDRDVKGDYGERNRTVLGFLDGHADYIEVIPNEETGPGYTFVWRQANEPNN